MRPIVIEPWMVDLGLRANELLCYATVWAQSQPENRRGKISISDFYSSIGLEHHTVASKTRELVKKGLIISWTHRPGDTRPNEYLAIRPGVTKVPKIYQDEFKEHNKTIGFSRVIEKDMQ